MGALGLNDTHGILWRPGIEILAESEGLRWSSAFAAIQRELPYEESFPAVDSHLVILHLDGYVKVDRWVDGGHDARVIGAGGTFVMPGGMDFRVRLGGPLSTVQVYLRDHILGEVARDLSSGDLDRIGLRPRLSERDPLLERRRASRRTPPFRCSTGPPTSSSSSSSAASAPSRGRSSASSSSP